METDIPFTIPLPEHYSV